MADEQTAEEQTVTRPRDIPDATAKKVGKPPMEPEVQTERNIRRYIRKDGVFIKDLEQLWRRDTGRKDAKGNPIYELEMGRLEAEAFVDNLCEKSGRKVVMDAVTGRLKAVPGWDLNIRVPGFEQSEQTAPKEPEGKVRQELNEKMLLELRESNKELREKLAEVQEALSQISGVEKKNTKDMNVPQLKKYAKDNELDIGDARKKPEILAAIDKARAEKAKDEG